MDTPLIRVRSGNWIAKSRSTRTVFLQNANNLDQYLITQLLISRSSIRCPVQENTTTSCVPVQCPPFPITSSNTTHLNSTHVASTCLPGFLPTLPQTYSCHLGSWLPHPITCTPDCSFINTTVEVKKTITNMGVRVCRHHHHTDSSLSSYTNCSEVSRSVLIGESIRVSSADLGGVVVLVRPQLQKLCIRYHDSNSTDSCVERCTDDIYLRIDTGDGLMIEVLRDVADADSLIVSHAAPSSNISSNVLLISFLVALFVQRWKYISWSVLWSKSWSRWAEWVTDLTWFQTPATPSRIILSLIHENTALMSQYTRFTFTLIQIWGLKSEKRVVIAS